MVNSSINFRVGAKHSKKRLVCFNITHNLPDFGFSFDKSFDDWIEDCDDPSDQVAFIEYLKTLNPNILAHANQ